MIRAFLRRWRVRQIIRKGLALDASNPIDRELVERVAADLRRERPPA